MQFESLLNQLSAITKGYNIVSRNSKNDFNVFKILNLQSDEVNLHSLFLAELLNPKGSHHQGNIFLKLFVDTIFENSECYLDINKAEVSVEKFIGPISNNKETGGRLDILIEDFSKNCIIIENKIYAGDQEKQLLRYYNYAKYQRSSHLFYLSLTGKEPESFSCCELTLGDHFKLLSYETDIINWLEKCHQASADSPFLRETIQQYIYLIKSLTGQTTNREMYQDIKSTVLSNSQNIESAYHIAKEFENIKIDLLIPFWAEVREKLTQSLGLNYDVTFNVDIKSNKNYSAIFVNEKKYESWNCYFAIEPLNGKSPWNPNKLYYGIWINSSRDPIKKQLIKLQNIFGQKTKNSNWWLDINYIESLNFAGIETFKNILPNTPSRLEVQEKIVNTFSNYIKSNTNLMSTIFTIINKK